MDPKQLLDELMGKNRNLLPSEKPNKQRHFTDPDLCKHFICGFCPNELFTNTKSDLGPCHKVHDAACREAYQTAPDKDRYRFEEDFLNYLERIINDLDKKIKRGRERLDHQDDVPDVPLSEEGRQRVEALNVQITDLLKKIQTLGEEGNIEEAEVLTQQVEVLKHQREDVMRGGEVKSINQQEKRMRVCEICGAFLVIGDTDKRTAGHLEGKQHQGFQKIRDALDEFRKKRAERRGSDRDYDRNGDRDRERDRERERGGRRRSRSPPRDRDRRGGGDRYRDRRDYRRDYHRDRHHDRRDRRDRGRDRRDRSRSHSRSRSRSRSPSRTPSPKK